MKNEVKTIDIQAKEWFDKVNGNSYFAGLVTVNYGMSDAREFVMPFQYGYGDSYRNRAIEVLKENNFIDSDKEYLLRDKGIVVRSNIVRKCKQRELKEYK
jgi:hypothetical protein